MQRATRLTIVLIVSMLLPILPFIVVGELPGERWLSQNDENALLFAITGSSLLAADIALPVPSSIVGTALGARLGFSRGFLWCWGGLMAGNLLGYAMGHLFPRRFITDLPRAPSEVVLFLSRPVPVLAEAATVVAGANRLDLRPFLAATALGNAVYAAVLCANASLWLPGDWRGPALALPMLLPALAWLLWRHVAERRGEPS